MTGALNNLFQSFSAWSATPNTTTAQAVLSQAQAVAQSFQSAAASLSQITTSVNQQISSNVSQINTLTAAIQQANIAIQNNHHSGRRTGRESARIPRIAFADRGCHGVVCAQRNGDGSARRANAAGDRSAAVHDPGQLCAHRHPGHSERHAGRAHSGFERPGHHLSDFAGKFGRSAERPQHRVAVAAGGRTAAGRSQSTGAAGRGPREFDPDLGANHGRRSREVRCSPIMRPAPPTSRRRWRSIRTSRPARLRR